MARSGADGRAHQLYEDHAKTCDPDDFWGQVKRTVGGESVGEDQIEMIVETVRACLDLKPDDVLLDLCCGNGALSDRVYKACAGGHGVDVSPHLIAIANRYFAAPGYTYEAAEVGEFAARTDDAARFTKALCYGSFKYLSDETAHDLLSSLFTRFPNITRLHIGNNADKALKEKFFHTGAYQEGLENAHDTFTGRWRTEGEFTALTQATGWQARFHRMPPAFYSAHYCFDAVLTRATEKGSL